MSLGIFVEGPSDTPAIPTLIRKLGYRGAIHSRVVSQGDMLNESKMSRHVGALLAVQPRVNRTIVFRDSEAVDPRETQRLTQPVSNTLSETSPVPVAYVVVDHSLEGWLLCDVEALRAVLGRSARIRTGGNPENHLRPAETMKRIFRANGKTFVKRVHNPQIADAATPSNITEKSPTFRHLVTVLAQADS